MIPPTVDELIAAVIDASLPVDVREACALALVEEWRAGRWFR